MKGFFLCIPHLFAPNDDASSAVRLTLKPLFATCLPYMPWRHAAIHFIFIIFGLSEFPIGGNSSEPDEREAGVNSHSVQALQWACISAYIILYLRVLSRDLSRSCTLVKSFEHCINCRHDHLAEAKVKANIGVDENSRGMEVLGRAADLDQGIPGLLEGIACWVVVT